MSLRSLVESRNVVIHDGQFNQIRGHHTSLVINLNQTASGSPPGSPSGSAPSNETDRINPAPSPGQSPQPNHERNQPQVSSQSQEIPLQKNNDIYERHLTPKGRGFPLWIPGPNQVLHIDYRRRGIRIGDVGIITPSGAFSFLFNICLPHDDPVNPRVLPEHFAPISPPIEAVDIDKFLVYDDDSHLASASIKRSQTSNTSGIVFESSASEGAILTMPRGANSEDLGNSAAFRDYVAANVADWYKFVNGRRGREAKNGDVRLVVGFDKTTSWGIATFSNQSTQNNCRLRFGPSETAGPASAGTYTWELSGVAEVKAGPGSKRNDELRRDSDPPDIQFENQCLFMRTLNVTLADDVWVDIHSSLGSVHVDPRHSWYPHVKDYSGFNHPHSNNPGTSSGSSSLPSQEVQSGIQTTAGSLYGSQDVNVTNNNPAMFISGPLESLMTHPSKILNNILLENVPTAKMAITHDNDWSSYDTLPDLHELVANILASQNVCEDNGVVFLQPKEILDQMLEVSASVSPVQVSEVKIGGLVEPATPFKMDNLGGRNEVAQLEVQVHMRKKLLGAEHPDTLISMGNLASTYHNQGRWNEAEKLEVQVMEMRKMVFGAEHPDTLISMGNLASTYSNQGRWNEAEELEVQVMEMRKKLLGEEHPYSLISMGNLACTYSHQGRWDEAEQLEVQVMELSEKLLGAGDPFTLTSMGNLASIYSNQGRWNEAEKLEVQVMEMRKEVLGAEHPDTLTSMANLASTYSNQERWNEVEQLEVQVMEMKKKLFSAEHPDTLISMGNLGMTYCNQGRWNEAEQLEFQVMDIMKRVLGTEHPSTLTSMGNLATTYHHQGKLNEAEQLGVQVMNMRKKLLGTKHPLTLTSMENLAMTYNNQGRWNEAEDLELEVMNIRKGDGVK
ncbi:TPR-like protein [Phlegmacium glaucopus]|nr:TPR-like protein [Phlegmacium glaucopus]